MKKPNIEKNIISPMSAKSGFLDPKTSSMLKLMSQREKESKDFY
jgi:hypothetical protein